MVDDYVDERVEKRLRLFRTLGAGMSSSDRVVYRDKKGGVRAREGRLTREEFEREMKALREDVRYVGTWPAVVVLGATILLMILIWVFVRWWVAVLIFGFGLVTAARVFRRCVERNARIWEKMERAIMNGESTRGKVDGTGDSGG